MAIDEVRARIASIQAQFSSRPVTLQPTRPSTTSTLAAGTGGTDFASLLQQYSATANTTPTVPTTTTPPPSGSAWSPTRSTGNATLDEFMRLAVAQDGDQYVWGSETSIGQADPTAFDCSELVQWAAGEVGVTVPDGSWYQYLDLKQKGQLMPVEEALRTPGALLFAFTREPVPGGPRPDYAHVAISLGDGRTIEARGSKYGVGIFEAGDRFQYAGTVPGLAPAGV